MVSTVERYFSAFLSYKHSDVEKPGQDWAHWVQQIDGYQTPREFIGTKSIYEDSVPASITHIFRDKHQIPGTGDLNTMIQNALDGTRILIVLCSPAAAASSYVNEEVRYFKKLGHPQRIVALILDGRPHSADPAEECFPPALAFRLGEDGNPDPARKASPVYIDLRSRETGLCAATEEGYRALLAGQHRTSEFIDDETARYRAHLEICRISLLSGILGLPPGQMTERERLAQIEAEKVRKEAALRQLQVARRRTRAAAVVCVVLGILLAAVSYATWRAMGESEKARLAQQQAVQEKEAAIKAKEEAEASEKTAKALRLEAQEQKATVQAWLGDFFSLSTWGSSLPDAKARPILEKIVAFYEKNPPAANDGIGFATFAASLNRLGDVLFGEGEVPPQPLSEAGQKDRQDAFRLFERGLEANQRVAGIVPTDFITIGNLGATYMRLTVASRARALAGSGDAAKRDFEAALSYGEKAEACQRQGQAMAVMAAKEAKASSVSAWWDANIAYALGAQGLTLENLANLSKDPEEQKALWRKCLAVRESSHAGFERAVKTATPAELESAKVWQQQATWLEPINASLKERLKAP